MVEFLKAGEIDPFRSVKSTQGEVLKTEMKVMYGSDDGVNRTSPTFTVLSTAPENRRPLETASAVTLP